MIPGTKQRVVNFSDLQAYLAVAIKHLRLMCLVMVFFLCLGLFYYVYKVPVYYSRALIEYETTPRPMDSESVWHDSSRWRLQARLQAPHIVQRIARECGLEGKASWIRQRYIKKVRFQNTSEGDLTMEVWATSYELAEKWTETALRVYLEYRDEMRMRRHEATIQSFTREMMSANQQTEAYHEKYVALQEELKFLETRYEWKSVAGLPERLVESRAAIARLERFREILDDDTMSIVERLALLSRANQGSNIKLGQILSIYDPTADNSTWEPDVPSVSLGGGDTQTAVGDGGDPMLEGPPALDDTGEDGGGKEQRIIVVPSMLAKPTQYTWEQLDATKRRLEGTLAAYDRIYLAGHRKMRALQKQIAAVDKALEAELTAARERLELEYKRRLAQQRNLEKDMPRYRELSRKMSQISREMAQFRATRLGWDQMATNMNKRLAVMDFAGDKERYQIRFGGLLQINPNPVSPHRLKLLIAALVLGLATALGAAFALEYLDHTVSLMDQVESQLGLPGLGVVPRFESTELKRPIQLLGEGHESHSLVETFRVVRTNLLTNKENDAPRQVVMVASSIPREGKSMVATNLAAAFANLGEKTLLVDADLRRGKIHRGFNTSASPGLSNTLQGSVALSDAVIATGVPNLYALTRGKGVKHVPELLLSDQFSELMKEARGQYERIVVDTPPVLGLSETCGMLPFVDGVLMVVWCGYTPLDQLKTATELLASNGATFYGCILNRLDLSAATHYQHYYYYSNYYYQSYRPDEVAPEVRQTSV